jgi:hypothetical protein
MGMCIRSFLGSDRRKNRRKCDINLFYIYPYSFQFFSELLEKKSGFLILAF